MTEEEAKAMMAWAQGLGFITLKYTNNDDFKKRNGCWCKHYDQCIAWLRFRALHAEAHGKRER